MFVDLVPARTAGDVLRTMADALGVEGDAARSSAELGAYLADRSMLIVLDNCEHVIDAGRRAGRRRARLRRHVAYRSPPAVNPSGSATSTSCPSNRSAPPPPSCSSNAPAGSNRASPWDASDERIVELCARLDGLPLAVELAAGQVRRWSLAELSRRLDDPAHRPAGPARPRPTPPPDDERRHRLELRAARRARAAPAPPSRRLPVELPTRRAGGAAAAARRHRARRGAGVAGGQEPRGARARHELVPVARDHPGVRPRAARRVRRARRRLRAPSAMGGRRRRSATSRLDRWMSGRLAARQRADAEHVRQAFWSSVDAGHARRRRRAGRHPLVPVAQRRRLRRGPPMARRPRRPRPRARRSRPGSRCCAPTSPKATATSWP